MRVSQLPLLFTTLTGSLVLAQQRCDVPSPGIYCNSTEILAYHSDDCKPFHVFVARGSDEPYPGRLGNLTSKICAAIGGSEDCGYEDVDFPAKSTAWGQGVWCDSAGKGAKSGQAQMKAYSDKCPDSKLIVLGFSQGASVAQDMLGGGGGSVFACEQDMNPALDATSAPGSNVVAAVTFGAVVRSRDQNFTVGRGVDYDGTSARSPEHLEGLNAYAGVLLDYCHFGDPICAVGSAPQDVNEHLNYFVQHNEEVVKWVSGMAKSSGDVSAKPSKPVISQSPSSTSVPARPAATPSGSATPSPVATTTDAAAKSAETSAETSATGAASSLTATVGYMTALALAMAMFL